MALLAKKIIEPLPAPLEQIIPKIIKSGLPDELSVLSLFSGCGGLDLGFMGGFEFLGKDYDRLPFNIIWANDIEDAACKTYQKNIGSDIHCGDIRNFITSLPKADIVIGGFPCQDVSINGKGGGKDGVRTNLYKAMIEAVRRIKPRVFVAENVSGLLLNRHVDFKNEILTGFKKLGYKIDLSLYLAADYGVPQMRERVFIIGTRNKVREFTAPTKVFSRDEWITTRMALKDLERKKENVATNHIWSKAKPNTEQGNRMLKADKPSYTIRAECHGNIQFHYKLPRRMSMREAARCQSFPDNFIFGCGIRQMERQIGNAVPPVLAWHIAKAVYETLS